MNNELLKALSQNIDFLKPVSELVKIHPPETYPGMGQVIVPLSCKSDFMEHFLVPFHVPLSEKGLEFPPDYVEARVWVADDCQTNVDYVKNKLEPVLGKATPTTASNTIGFSWSCQETELSISVFPPELQVIFGDQVNDLHVYDPRNMTACSLNLKVGYLPEITSDEMALLAQSQLLVPRKSKWMTLKRSFGVLGMRYSRRYQGCEPLEEGVWLSVNHERVFVVAGEDFVTTFLASDVEMVYLTKLSQGRGSAMAYLGVQLVNADRIEIMSYDKDEGALDDEAELLSKALGAKLEVSGPFPNI